MSSIGEELCIEVEETIADVLEGMARIEIVEHIAECDRCRDFKYEAEQTVLAMESVGADFHPTDGFADRMLGLVFEARPDGPVPSSSAVQPTSGAHPVARQERADVRPSIPAPTSAEREIDRSAVASAKTEFAPVSLGAALDNNATIFTPAPTMLGDAQVKPAPTLLGDDSAIGALAARRAGNMTELGAPNVTKLDVHATQVGEGRVESSLHATQPGEPREEATALNTQLGDVGPDATLASASDAFVPTHKTMPLSAAELQAYKAERTKVSAPQQALTPMPPERERPHVVEAHTGRNNTGSRPFAYDTTPPVTGAQPAGATVPAEKPPITKVPETAPVRRIASVADTRPAASGNVVSLFRRKGFIAALVGGMAAAAAAGALMFRDRGAEQPPPVAKVDGAWSGTVLSIAHAGGGEAGNGFQVCKASGNECQPLANGGAIESGSTLRTDSKTRAKVKLSDETWLAIDRNSEVTLPLSATREAKLTRGMMVADVRKIEGGQPAKISVPQGEVQVIGTKVALTVSERRSAVEVVRGEVEVTSKAGSKARVRAGEEATMSELGEPIVASKSTMSDVLEWSSESADEVDAPNLRGVGELRAKRPGEAQERAGAVRLTKHSVKVRVVDVMARTEIDETFTNTTNDELEGIFRFPLPPGAQIENLSLEVDGKLMEGAFVDRTKGAAIWRGVIQNAQPKAVKPKEEIFWVAGPWRDPALLEWQRGGRFELRIFPIPKNGSRRVVLTYTQTVPQSGGVRRFTYPLAHDTSGSTKVDEFNLDVQVLGHDQAFGVDTRGYQLVKASGNGEGDRFVLNEKNFVPSGDLTVEYGLPTRDKELTSWAYDMPPTALAVTNGTGTLTNTNTALANNKPLDGKDANSKAKADAEALAISQDTSAYVALAVRPKLPRFPEGKDRLHVIVVDSSRSMVGERFSRATRLASSIVREMDRRDQFLVLACDITCRPMGGTEDRLLPAPSEPSPEAAQQVESFLGSIEPDGGSNLLTTMQAARTAAGALKGRELRILYLGDGTPTVGPTKSATIEAGIRHILPSGDGTVVTVALGSDADTTSLTALARGGNGVVVPYVPGQRVGAAAVDVLAAAYGSVLSDVEVVLPPGLTQVTPRRIDPIAAGGETFIMARMPRGQTIDGNVTLRGRVGNERFEQTYATKIIAKSNAGNAFVPRLFASARINELEQQGLAEDRERVVALSRQFRVASHQTSIVVLESEAMFKAFGLDRSSAVTTVFTGEERADGTSADADGDAKEEREEGGGSRPTDAEDDGLSANDKKREKASPSAEPGFSNGTTGGAARGPMPSPTATSAPMTPPPQAAQPAPDMAMKKPAKRAEDPFDPSWGKRPSPPRPPVVVQGGRVMIPMKKVFDRRAQFSADRLLATEVSKALTDAQGASKLAPDSRDKTISLYKALMASGRVGEALELVSRWAQRDAMDPDALLARADLAAMSGDRARALRILSGLADVRPGDKAVQKRLISAFTQMGQANVACQHRISLAEIDPTDTTAVASAVRCSQDEGFPNLAQAVLSESASNLRDKITNTATSLKLNDLPALTGDVKVSATWTTPVDLDIALVDKNGKRLSWLGSTLPNVTVNAKDATSTSGETLSLTGLSSGNMMVEIVRASTDRGNAPVTGELTFTLPGGQVQKVPFTLTDQRLDVGSLRVFFNTRMVRADMPAGGWR